MMIGLAAMDYSSYPKTVAGYQACASDCATPYAGQESIITPQPEADCFQACAAATGISPLMLLAAMQQPAPATATVMPTQNPCSWWQTQVVTPGSSIVQCTNDKLYLILALNAAIIGIYLFTSRREAGK